MPRTTFLRPFYLYGATSETADAEVQSGLSAEPIAGAPRYVVEAADSDSGQELYALRDVRTDRVVKLYRSSAVAYNDARFLNVLRPPIPLG